MVNSFAANGVSNLGLDVFITVIFIVLSVMVALIAVVFFAKYINMPSKNKSAASVASSSAISKSVETSQNDSEQGSIRTSVFNFTAILFAILAIGFIIRIITTFLIKGYREDFDIIIKIMESSYENGMTNFYKANGFSTFPVIVYIYSFLGLIGGIFGITSISAFAPFLIKLPFIVCDILTAVVLYKLAAKYSNKIIGLVSAAFIMLFPLFIFASSVWGSTFSILSFFLVLSFYFLAKKNIPALIGTFSIALLTSKEAIFVLPVVAALVIYSFVKSILYIKANKLTFASALKDSESSSVLTIPVTLVACFILMYLFCLPLLAKTNVGVNIFGYLDTFFFSPLIKFEYFGFNGLSIYNIFGRNGAKINSDYPIYIFSIIFIVVIIAIVTLIYLYRKNRANLVFLGGYVLLTLSTYFVGASAISVLPAITLFFMSFILIKDKRILHIVLAVSVAMLFNACMVMTSAGYFNNAENYLFSSSNSLYLGKVLLNGGVFMAMSIVSTIIAFLSHLYATIILLDISMGKDRRLFKTTQNAKIGAALKNWFTK